MAVVAARFSVLVAVCRSASGLVKPALAPVGAWVTGEIASGKQLVKGRVAHGLRPAPGLICASDLPSNAPALAGALGEAYLTGVLAGLAALAALVLFAGGTNT